MWRRERSIVKGGATMNRPKRAITKLDARRADSRDVDVGKRVRSRRVECGLSQTELANKIGVTFQQVQKYEKGVNRIGASRLQRIAEALEVPITFFFDATPNATMGVSRETSETVFHFMQNAAAVRLVKAFHRIKSREARQSLVSLAEKLASDGGDRN